jgi:hypothetical protein
VRSCKLAGPADPALMLVGQSIGMGLRKEDAGLSVRPTLRQEAFLEGVEQDLTQLNKSDDSHIVLTG